MGTIFPSHKFIHIIIFQRRAYSDNDPVLALEKHALKNLDSTVEGQRYVAARKSQHWRSAIEWIEQNQELPFFLFLKIPGNFLLTLGMMIPLLHLPLSLILLKKTYRIWLRMMILYNRCVM